MRKVNRQEIPPVLLAALSLWLTCALILPWMRSFPIGLLSCIVGFGALGFALAFACLLKFGHLKVIAALLGIFLGFSCTALSAISLQNDMQQLEEMKSHGLRSYSFRLSEDGRRGPYGQTCEAILAIDGKRFTVQVRTKLEEPLYYGDVIKGRASIQSISDEKAERFWNDGVAGLVSIGNASITNCDSLLSPLLSLRKQVVQGIADIESNSDAQAVTEALICGYKANLYDSEAYPHFQQCGLAHMVAVSGAHLSIIGGLIASLCSNAGLRRRKAAVIQGVFIGTYLILAAIPVSGIRATLMTCCVLLALFPRRRASSLNALGLCIALLVGLDPHQALSVSFCLSAGSTLGIVLFSSYTSRWIYRMARPIPRFIREGMSVTIAANATTLLYSVALFNQLSLISVLANIVAAPLFTISCSGGMLCAVASSVIPSLSGCLLNVGVFLAQILCWIVQAMASIPGGCIAATLPAEFAIAITIGLVAGLYLWWPEPDKRTGFGVLSACAILIAVAALLTAHPFATEIIMLDVGQGDSFVIRSLDRQVMIDTGNQPAKLKQALARNGIRNLDALIISHADDDHCGCIQELTQVVDVRAVYIANDALTCPCESCSGLRATVPNAKAVRSGDEIRFGCITMEVIWPEKYLDEGGNADSLCLLAKADANNDGEIDQTALFCGDAESEQLNEMLKRQLLGQITIYKVGHHGSKHALDDETISALKPVISLVSVGESNRYGHPSEETMQRLESVGSKIYRTDLRGDVVCRLEADGVRVSSLR